MGIDVATVLAQYEDAEIQTPMHGRPGEVRRNPSADQKKVRRQMTKKQADAEIPDISTIAELRQQAALAPTLAAQQELIAKAEELDARRRLVTTAERALDLTIKEAVEIIPAGQHELTTESTDWLTSIASAGIEATANQAQQALVAEAALWDRRVPDFVREVPEEYFMQAKGQARKVASSYGEHSEVAAQAFMAEAKRLHTQAVGSNQALASRVASLQKQAEMLDVPVFGGEEGETTKIDPEQIVKNMRDNDPQPGPEITGVGVHPHARAPHIRAEMDRMLQARDADGVREMGEGYAHAQVHGSKVASLRPNEDADLFTVLAGFEPDSLDGVGEVAGQVMHGLDQASDGVRQDGSDFASRQVNAASTLPQADSNSGTMTTNFPTYAPQTSADANTDSNRAPALQEIQDFTGWDGTSVVPHGDSGAAAANADGGSQDASADDALAGNFPVGSAYASRKTASKESAMTTEHRACPTCGGHGKVAVRKEAYSGLPQIDQIVNADETPGTTNLPTEVAFPVNPNWGNGSDVQNAINETEGLISQRNGRSPLMTAASVQGYDQNGRPATHVANGRDNSGWLGDNGAKGLDYPGYSAPTGYDGSNNLGEPDPVYGYGGDKGNQPLKPTGADEENDYTNDPGMNWQPGQPTQADQGYRQTGPAMSTQGSVDPVLASAHEEMARLQRTIAERTAQLQRQGR